MNASAHAQRRTEQAPGILLQLLEVRAIWEHCAAIAMRPIWGVTARGDGHPVLVLPGLAAGDATTALMRRFRERAGSRPSAGYRDRTSACARVLSIGPTKRFATSSSRAGARSVSSAGTLGGLYARDSAKLSPEMVRFVITLGSPFTAHPRPTNAWRLYEFASGHRVNSRDFHGRLRPAPPPCRQRRSGVRPTAL